MGEFDIINTKEEQKTFMTKVYGWMFLGLLITGFVAMYTVSSQSLLELIFSSNITFYGLLIGELVLVAYLSAAVHKMSASAAGAIFLVYSALNGLTLSVIFLAFTADSIASTFFITSVTFGLVSVYGFVTKKDLTSLGSFAFMGLVGIILASLVNFFLKSEMVYWVTSYVGVVVFVVLTAYDTNKIKQMNIIGNEGTEEGRKEAIMGALSLYLDFINLFLFLLRILGRRR